MLRLGPQSIRGKVTLAATLATAFAMALVVAVTAYAMQHILTDMISASLDERLDRAQAEVAAGNYQAAIDLAGEEMMQIVDANGNILAETPNARGLAALTRSYDDDDDDDDRFDTFAFEREDDDEDEDDGNNSSQKAYSYNSGAASGAASGNATGAANGNASGSANGNTNAHANGSAGGASNNTVAPASRNSDDNDNDDDAAEEARERAEKAAKEAAERAEEERERAEEAAKEAAERAEEERERAEEAAEEREKQQAAAKEAAERARVSDDDDHDDDDDEDEDEADDDKKSKSAKCIGIPFASLARFATPSSAASASQTKDAGTTQANSSQLSQAQTGSSAYIDASDVLGDEGPYLVKKRNVESPDGPVTLAAITSLASASRTASLATQLLITLFLALLCFVVAFTWNMAARTLQPVEQMRATAESITASNLSERIPVPTRDRDLSRLATTFNELLARVETSFNEQRRFVSDASHELKSPVAATGIMLETLREHPEAVNQAQVVDDLTHENNRLASIVGDLLTLARSDEGRMQIEKKPIDLMDLLFEEVASLKTHTNVALDTRGIEPIVCSADAELLSHAVRNLLENAARFARTTVKVACRQDENIVRIVVSDDGPGIAPEDRERVFDRFVRLQDSRSDPGSTGLGLPVARSIAQRHGGTIEFIDGELGGATAVLSIPLS